MSDTTAQAGGHVEARLENGPGSLNAHNNIRIRLNGITRGMGCSGFSLAPIHAAVAAISLFPPPLPPTPAKSLIYVIVPLSTLKVNVENRFGGLLPAAQDACHFMVVLF